MHNHYNRYSYVLNNPLKYTDPSGWKYMFLKDNKADDPPINFDNFYSNYGGGSGGGYSDIFSFGNSSSSSPHYNWSTGQYMQGGNQISFQSVQYWLNQTYTKTYTGNYGYMYSDRISSNGIGYGIIPVYEYRGSTISKSTNVQTKNNFAQNGGGGGFAGLIKLINIGLGSTGFITQYMDVIAKTKISIEAQKTGNIVKAVQSLEDLKPLGNFTEKLGYVGVTINFASFAHKIIVGQEIKTSDVFDVTLGVGLSALTITNPVYIIGLGVYGFADAWGAFDAMKERYLNQTIIKSRP